jgi:protein SCO1/2
MKIHLICGAVFLTTFLQAAAVADGRNDTPAQLKNVGIDQRLNEQVPLDTTFKDEYGRIVQLENYFGKRPVVLVLAYYDCPMLCGLVLQGLATAMRQMSFDAGDQYNVVTVSFNPRETPELAAATKSKYVKQYGRPGGETGWHFLTGEEPDIKRLTSAVGFRYSYDPVSGQYAHAAGIMVVTPEGRLARYFYGIEYSPRDLRLALVEASQRKIGNPVDAVLLFCCRYDPVTGKYGLVVTRVLQLAGLVTVVVIGLFIGLMVRRDRRLKRSHA